MAANSDSAWMREAIRLSRRGFPAPNPHVGCVIIKDGQVVGRGFHGYASGPHAEVVALAHAGDSARGADVYVTLEPCNHHGRTPPCVDALIRAGVAKVIVGCLDPNPDAQGGSERLVASGIEVRTGVLEKQAFAANEPWMVAVKRSRPYVIVKAAITLDGRIARLDGKSKWVTGPAARAAGRRLRAEMGAVLVGRKTIQADNPELTSRTRGAVNPVTRVVLDPKGRLSGLEKVFDGQAPTLWFGGDQGRGAITCPMASGRVNHAGLLNELWSRGIRGLLVEGGGETIRGFLEAGVVDRVELFVAPKVFGAGIGWCGEAEVRTPDQMPELVFQHAKRIGPDLRITYGVKG